MKQKEMSYVLKALDILSIAACLALMFVVLPPIARLYIGSPESTILYGLFIAVVWLGFVPVIALALIAWGVFSQIGKDNSFSLQNASRLRVMSYLAGADVLVWLAGLVFFTLSGVPAIGIMLAFTVAMALCIILAVVCASLSHLTSKAALLKAENDLTV